MSKDIEWEKARREHRRQHRHMPAHIYAQMPKPGDVSFYGVTTAIWPAKTGTVSNFYGLIEAELKDHPNPSP